MPQEIHMIDMIKKLTPIIQEVIFSQELENFISTISSAAQLNDDQEVWLHSYITDLLIGKLDIESFKTNLFNIVNEEPKVNLIFDFLNQKLLSKITEDLIESQNIYKKELQKLQNFNSTSESIPAIKGSNETMSSYIQELAASIKKKETIEEKVLDTTIPEEKPIEKKIIINVNDNGQEEKIETKEIKADPIISEMPIKEKETESEPIPIASDIPSLTPKESIVLNMMKKKEEQSNGKLNEYFKALKDNLSVGITEEKENVFQPPFKATKGRSMLVESEMMNNDTNPTVAQAQTTEPKKEPVKYNSFNYIKKPTDNTVAKPTDEKFIDLGDF